MSNSGSGSDSDGRSPTDIITYIGVPLAVLGVLPILYNTVITLAAVSKIKRTLRRSRLTALTRSDVVNRTIEIELPRYAVTPWDRFNHRSEYWTLSRHPSNIPGGSWTTFNWRTNTIGLKTQRVEYADQLRQPQVDINFDELVCYLLDLGATPDAHGWRLLRSTGLWTPVGCSLMLSPDGSQKALAIAPLDDSDGHLSLKVTWAGHWTTRDYSQLPPYWVRLPPALEDAKAVKESGSEPSSKVVDDGAVMSLTGDEGSSLRKESLDSVQKRGETDVRQHITCQISVDGVVSALQEAPIQSNLQLDSLYIEHIRVQKGKSDGVWFASACSAYGTTSQTILWNYKIPDEIISFAGRETVPCGVLVLLGVVDESETPDWETKYNDGGAALDMFVQRNREHQEALAAEARLPPPQREQAAKDRQRKESQQRMQDMRDKMRIDSQRREQRMSEALQSPRWDNKAVAERYLAWMKKYDHISQSLDVKESVGQLLHRMVLDGQFASSLCRMLDTWKSWADNGGMRRADFGALQDDPVTFARAVLMISIIKDSSVALEGTLSMDLQECLRMWRTVRLG